MHGFKMPLSSAVVGIYTTSVTAGLKISCQDVGLNMQLHVGYVKCEADMVLSPWHLEKAVFIQ
jgi:hypothetical protein